MAETSDVDIGGIFGFAVGLSVAGVFVCVLVWLLFTLFAAREARRVTPAFPLAAGQADRLPPEPRLQTNPRQDLRDLRSAEDAVLTGYGWVDKSAGVVRIPIGEAMKLTVKRGLPARREKP
jgi:hypothetical protein